MKVNWTTSALRMRILRAFGKAINSNATHNALAIILNFNPPSGFAFPQVEPSSSAMQRLDASFPRPFYIGVGLRSKDGNKGERSPLPMLRALEPLFSETLDCSNIEHTASCSRFMFIPRNPDIAIVLVIYNGLQ
jgi:hypothetical protein